MKACIFDLDGTILNTLEAIALSGNRMLAELGLPPQPADDYRYHCGDGADLLVKRCLEEAGAFTEENYRAGCVLQRKFLREKPTYRTVPYDGMPEVLNKLKNEGIRIAVCTNKPDEAAKGTVYGIYGEDLFDLVIGQKEGIPTKPDPTGALLIARMLGAEPEECLYFGDTWTDRKTGKAAGMYTVGVLWGYRDREELEENGADRIIAKPDEIPGLIAELGGIGNE